MDRFRQWLSAKHKTVVVPNGYSVVVVRPSPDPDLHRTESGFWIANLGSREHIEPEFRLVESAIRDDPKSSVVWFLQEGLLGYWVADAPRIVVLRRRFHRIRQFRAAQGCVGQEMLSYWPTRAASMSELLGPNPPIQQRRVADIAVVADIGSHARALMTLLASIGIPTYLANLEEGIFAEVHTPDKIIVAIPGTEVAPYSDQPLRLPDLERDTIEKSLDSGDRPAEEGRALAYVEEVVRAAIPSAGTSPGSEAKLGPSLLSDLMAQYHDQGPKAYGRFIEAFLRSKVGIQTSGGEQAGEGRTSTSENPITIQMTTSDDGRIRILVFADPPVYAMQYGEQFNALIGGDEILRVMLSDPSCEGIFVNSALHETGMLIGRETALAVLRS